MNKTNDFKYNLPAYSDPVDIEDLNDNFRGIDDALMAGLCKKEYTGNNMGSSDPSARKYAWAPWFEIVNDNEFDVVVTDRNAPVESEEATINIAAGQTFRKYINGRYYMNFYVQDQRDVTFKWFTNAETYINESGGGGGGTGTVTSVSVQGGSGSHLTGSGNPIETSGTIIINVDEGYSIPSDNEQTAWDGKAVDIALSIDSSTYVMTAQLKDSAGNLIGTAKTIDLPLETMVVDGEYDSQTKKIKLELKNGNYVEFSVADLVSGLQTELSASNKLDPDYIDYDSSHRAVSDTEKSTWNGKQNALTFDDTPTQNSNNPVKSGGVYSALAGKQASLDSTQLAAVNSGIDSAKVAQISTNQTNILYALETGAANYAPLDSSSRSGSGYFLDATQSCMKVFTSGTVMHIYCEYTKTVNTQFSIQFTNDSGNVIASTSVYAPSASTSGTISADVTLPQDVYGYNAYYNGASGNTCTITKVMICPKNVWDAIQKYVPYSVPNSDLTYLEAEDRAALAEEIDAGAKNKLKINSYTCTGSEGRYGRDDSLSIPAGDYVLVAKVNQTANAALTLMWGGTQHDFNASGAISNTVKTWNVHATSTITSAWVYFNKTNDTWTEVMLCTKAAFGVSQKFVAYKPSYDDLIAQSTYTTSTSNTSITNLLYTAANAVGVSPSVIHFFMVSIYSDASDCLVICGAYKHGVVGYGVSMANRNITFEGTVNNLGTVGWTGGTAPYHVQVRFF